MIRTFRLRACSILSLVALPSLFAAGCGTSGSSDGSSPASPAPTTASSADSGASPGPDDSGAPAEAGPPARTLKKGAFTATASRNLILDPDFGNSRFWGHWQFSYPRVTERVGRGVRTWSSSPGGVGAVVALAKDAGSKDTTAKVISITSTFLGGPGPFTARVWVTASDANDKPIDVPTAKGMLAAAILGAPPSGGAAYDLVRDDSATQKIGGRTWVLLTGKVGAALERGGYFVIQLGRTGGHWYLQAPEVVADGVGDSTKSLEAFAPSRVIDSVESAALEEYRKIPVQLGGRLLSPELTE